MAFRGGSIIFNASTGAYQSPDGIAAYGVTKTCLLAITKALAQNLAPYKIRVNGVAPGLIRTTMAQVVSYYNTFSLSIFCEQTHCRLLKATS